MPGNIQAGLARTGMIKRKLVFAAQRSQSQAAPRVSQSNNAFRVKEPRRGGDGGGVNVAFALISQKKQMYKRKRKCNNAVDKNRACTWPVAQDSRT